VIDNHEHDSCRDRDAKEPYERANEPYERDAKEPYERDDIHDKNRD